MGWSQHDVDARNARIFGEQFKANKESVKRESDLHDKIIEDCKNRLWLPIHSRMDRKTTTKNGTCDFIIFADNGRKFYIECKSATGKLSDEQQIFIAWMKRLKHTVHVISSFKEYLEIVK